MIIHAQVLLRLREIKDLGAETAEGRARAKARGVKLGPKFKLTPAQQRDALERLAAGEASTTIGKDYNVSHTTILRLRSLVELLRAPTHPRKSHCPSRREDSSATS
jgi:hypothetical protein